jgi:hypothetical protein
MSGPVAIIYVEDSSDKIISGTQQYDRDNGGVLVVPLGTTFPTSPVANELFVFEDGAGAQVLYKRNAANDAWEPISVAASTVVPGVTGVVLLTQSGTKTAYTTITAALAAASANDTVVVGPGSYAESFTVPAGVLLRAAHGNRVFITGGAATGTRITLSADASIISLTVVCPTDDSPAVYCPPAAVGAIASEVVIRGNTSSSIGIRTETFSVLDKIRYSGGTCDTVVDVTGANAQCGFFGFVVFDGTIATGIKVSNGAFCTGDRYYTSTSPTLVLTDALSVADGELRWGNSTIENCTNGLRVTSDDAVVRAKSIQFENCTADLLVDSGITDAEVRLLSCYVKVDKLVAPASWLSGGKSTLSIQDDKEDDDGFKIFGELQVGLPEQGRESAFGEGDSYTRELAAFTTDDTTSSTSDGANFIDVATVLQSPESSVASFQGITTGYSILIGSTLENDVGEKLRFFGVKIKQVVAAVVDAGGTHDSFAFEYWDGSAWTEVDTFATESSDFYRYADEVFLRANSSEHIRFGINSNNTLFPWAEKSINGVLARWMRIRIKTDVLTAPTFQQIKLSPSRTEINADGFLTHHGEARYRKTVLIPGNVWGESGGVGNANVAVGTGGNPTGWDHNIKNSFLNSNGDAVYVQLPLERGVCTSCPWQLKFIFVPSATSNGVQVVASFLAQEVTGVLEADPSGGKVPIPRTEPNTETLTSKAATVRTQTINVVAGKLQAVTFSPYSIARYYEGDMLFIRIELDDDGDGNANLLAMGLEIAGVLWTPGEHV